MHALARSLVYMCTAAWRTCATMGTVRCRPKRDVGRDGKPRKREREKEGGEMEGKDVTGRGRQKVKQRGVTGPGIERRVNVR